MVTASCERLIAVCFPFSKEKIYRHRKKFHINIVLPVVVALVMYSFTLVTSGLVVYENEPVCATRPEWIDLTEKLGLFDIVIATIAPLTIVIFIYSILMGVLVRKLILSIKTIGVSSRTGNETTGGFDLSEMGASGKSPTHTSLSDPERRRLAKKNSLAAESMVTTKNKKKIYSKTTCAFILLSTFFLFLNLPVAFVKLRHFFHLSDFFIKSEHNEPTTHVRQMSVEDAVFNSEYADVDESSQVDILTAHVTCYMYYLSFAVNFFLFYVNSHKFRLAFKRLFDRNCHEVNEPFPLENTSSQDASEDL
jgi:hypothetical protein